MKVFVIGSSGSGKTPFAKKISEAFGFTYIVGSEWVKKLMGETPYKDKNERITAMTTYSLEKLREDPNACLTYIRTHYDLTKDCVIDGLRNPHDFVPLFDPKNDIVVFLNYTKNTLPKTSFESGIPLIEKYVMYLKEIRTLNESTCTKWYSYDFTEFWKTPFTEHDDSGKYSLEEAINEFSRSLASALWKRHGSAVVEKSPKIACDHGTIHVEIDPFEAYVKKEFLYDMDPEKVGEFVHCKVFAISSYEGSAPTFNALLDDGSVFSYLPPWALTTLAKKTCTTSGLEDRDLVYHNCPSGKITVNHFSALNGSVNAYFKNKKKWVSGKYILTVDWYEGNDLLHLVLLDTGEFAFLPHHKIKFGDGVKSFEPYKKMHETWSV